MYLYTNRNFGFPNMEKMLCTCLKYNRGEREPAHIGSKGLCVFLTLNFLGSPSQWLDSFLYISPLGLPLESQKVVSFIPWLKSWEKWNTFSPLNCGGKCYPPWLPLLVRYSGSHQLPCLLDKWTVRIIPNGFG